LPRAAEQERAAIDAGHPTAFLRECHAVPARTATEIEDGGHRPTDQRLDGRDVGDGRRLRALGKHERLDRLPESLVCEPIVGRLRHRRVASFNQRLQAGPVTVRIKAGHQIQKGKPSWPDLAKSGSSRTQRFS